MNNVKAPGKSPLSKAMIHTVPSTALRALVFQKQPHFNLALATLKSIVTAFNSKNPLDFPLSFPQTHADYMHQAAQYKPLARISEKKHGLEKKMHKKFLRRLSGLLYSCKTFLNSGNRLLKYPRQKTYPKTMRTNSAFHTALQWWQERIRLTAGFLPPSG